MAKGKYEYWITDEGLTLLRGWKRNGLTDEVIADKAGISTSTLYDWKNKHPEISEALTRGREIADISVEDALYEKTQSRTIMVKKTFKVKSVDYDKETGRKIREWEELREGYDEVYIPADEKAQEFWLTNRSSDRWKKRREDRVTLDSEGPFEVNIRVVE